MAARAKTAELIESEGRILKLSYDPGAPPGSVAARIQIFSETTSVNLDPDDIDRVRRALAKRAAKGGL
ncbi:MAG TPA: hypothetical protein VH853_00430 [Polyangia bacterium]|jgi:hypothetical protein|nr:hypothetical protein [Polyangia bacterium]